MDNIWVKNAEDSECYIDIPGHGKVDLKPHVWGVYFYESIKGKGTSRIILGMPNSSPAESIAHSTPSDSRREPIIWAVTRESNSLNKNQNLHR